MALLIAYMLYSNILLVNLLIAMMSTSGPDHSIIYLCTHARARAQNVRARARLHSWIGCLA